MVAFGVWVHEMTHLLIWLSKLTRVFSLNFSWFVSLPGTPLFTERRKGRMKKKCDLFEGTHLGVMICCVLTPDGRFRLTSKPPNGVLICHFFPLSMHRKYNNYLHLGLVALLVSVHLGSFTASLLLETRLASLGNPWKRFPPWLIPFQRYVLSR